MPRLDGASRSKASATLPVWSSTFSLSLLPLFWSALARQRFSRRYHDIASPVARLPFPRSDCSFQRVRLSPGTRRRVATPEAWYRDTALQSASGPTSVWPYLILHCRAFSRLHSPRHGLQSVISRRTNQLSLLQQGFSKIGFSRATVSVYPPLSTHLLE